MNAVIDQLNEEATDIDQCSDEMFELYTNGYYVDEEGKSWTSTQSLLSLTEYFGSIPRDSRGDVFEAFLGKLKNANIALQMEQVMGSPEDTSENTIN